MEEQKISLQTPKKRGVIWPLILIFLGIVFLLTNLGLVSVEIWSILWLFWPVVLILVGFEILLGRLWFGRLLSILISFITLTAVLTLSVASLNPVFRNWFQRKIPWPIPEVKVFDDLI